MSKFAIDYSSLETKVYKKAYRLSDVKDQLETVSFDIVRFKDDDKGADLWQVQSSDDGDYIVAIYQPEEEEKVVSASWDVVINKVANEVQVSYKGDPLVKIAASRLGIPNNELHKMAEYLPFRLSESKKLVKLLLNELNKSAKEQVLSKYPELV